MRRLITFLTMALLLAGLAMAYSGDVTISGLSAEGNSTNLSTTVQGAAIATSGDSANYTLDAEAYAHDAEKDIYVAPPPSNDDGPSGSSGSSSSTSFFPSGSASPEATPGVSVSFSSLVSTENDSLIIDSPRADDSFSELNVTLRREMQNVHFRVVESLGTAQRSELSSFTGEVYKLLDIEHDDIPSEDIQRIRLSFKVEKEWVENRNLEPGNVTLFRYDGFSWNGLVTRLERTDATYYYFNADSPGLSTYAVGAKSAPAAQPEEENATAVASPASPAEADNTTAGVMENQDDPWSDYEEPKNLGWLWGVVAVVIIGAAVTFIILRKKGSPEKKDPPVAVAENTPAAEPETEAKADAVLFNNDDERVLTDFIRALQEKGVDVKTFKPKLVAKGWSEEQVEHCLKSIQPGNDAPK